MRKFGVGMLTSRVTTRMSICSMRICNMDWTMKLTACTTSDCDWHNQPDYVIWESCDLETYYLRNMATWQIEYFNDQLVFN